jgi:hypothetical protein
MREKAFLRNHSGTVCAALGMPYDEGAKVASGGQPLAVAGSPWVVEALDNEGACL